MDPKEQLIVALDVDSFDAAVKLVEKLKAEVRFFKVGLELFSSCGPHIVTRLKESGCDIFLDLKLHDIPNTVGKTAASLTRLGVHMFNVHALGGYDMMKAAAEAAEKAAKALKTAKPKVLAVTILTSLSEIALKKVGVDDNMKAEVERLARLAKESGLDGIVASSYEAKIIRDALGDGFLIVTPGIRPLFSQPNDQVRVAGPKKAIQDGADFIVVGRPIIEAPDPLEAVKRLYQEMRS